MEPKLIFQNISKIDKSLTRLSKKKKEKTQIIKSEIKVGTLLSILQK